MQFMIWCGQVALHMRHVYMRHVYMHLQGTSSHSSIHILEIDICTCVHNKHKQQTNTGGLGLPAIATA